jgi:hypothetical protein
MPTYEMRAPNGRVYRIQGPAGATDAQVKAKILEQFPEAGKAKPRKKVGRVEAALQGVAEGMRPVAEFAEKINPINYLVDPLLASGKKAIQTSRRRGQQQARLGERDQPNYFTGGKIAGEVVATAPFTLGAGAGLQAVGRGVQAATKLKKVGKAIETVGRTTATGGVGVRAPSTAATRAGQTVLKTRAQRVAARAAGGTVAGVTAAALTDNDLLEAAAAGAAVPVFGHMAKFGAGKTFDTLAGRLGEVRAAEIMRQLIADNPSQIAKALRNAPAKIRANTAEFLASRGLLTPELAAATRIASASKQSGPLLEMAQRRATGQNRMREIISGGGTQTEAVSNIAETRKALQDITGPQREGALTASDVGRTQIIPLEREAARLRQLASEEAENARRLLTANDRNANLIRESGLRLPADIKRQREIVAGLERFGGEAAGRSVAAGTDARAAEAAAANLRAQGLQPLDISSVVSTLRQKASEAEFVSPDRFRILSEFANNLERRAAKMGGVIDATGLYLARREMGSFVSSILNTSDPKALRQGTAQLIGEAQPLIDDAIEAAGGRGWREYLNTFAEGMKGIERQQFQRELTQLPEARFAKVMAGGDPDYVEEFFGPGRFDINVELQGPDLATANKLGRDIEAQRAVAQTGLEDLSPSQRLGFAAGARENVGSMLEPTVPNMATMAARVAGGAPRIYGGGIAAEQAGVKLAERASDKVMEQLVPALARPSRAASLIQVRPAEEYIDTFLYGRGRPPVSQNVMSQMGFALRSPLVRQNMLAQMAARPFNQPTVYPFPEIDPDTGEALIEVTFDEYGRATPVYGRVTR